ncbi:MAG: hypothetical protein H7070_14065 [Saprospiraceae bacterium]|nr:hypothetical protein [Pyrinomonadaceae bacterium]
MALSPLDKNDLISSVYIEMERMFTVLYYRTTPEELQFFHEVESVLKSRLKEFGESLNSTNSSSASRSQ